MGFIYFYVARFALHPVNIYPAYMDIDRRDALPHISHALASKHLLDAARIGPFIVLSSVRIVAIYAFMVCVGWVRGGFFFLLVMRYAYLIGIRFRYK